MKKTLLFFCSALALNLSAEVVTLDLTRPLNPATLEFSEQDIWAQTYNDAADFSALEFQIFSFSHLWSGNSWGGTYWDGFSVSRVSSDTLNYNSCMAKGGLAGVGTPYIIGYWSDFTEGVNTNTVVFNDGNAWFPQEVCVCQNPVAYKCITEGYSPARKFAAGDSFTLTVQALNSDYEVDPDRAVVCYLADYRAADEAAWTVNRAWQKVDLSPLGACYGLVFSVQSTDSGTWGINTATCFALDGLSVSSDPTALAATVAPGDVADWQVYSVSGQYLQSVTATLGGLRNRLPQGIYVVRSGSCALKIVK